MPHDPRQPALTPVRGQKRDTVSHIWRGRGAARRRLNAPAASWHMACVAGADEQRLQALDLPVLSAAV
jgi:hypothetical protein